jgi:large subunit ribosomal protein L20
MPRVTCAVARHKRKKRLMKRVKGYWGGRSKLLRTAKETYYRSMAYAFSGRKNKKRNFRSLWITRISGALTQYGLCYSKFMGAVKKAGIIMNRKVLSELAIADPAGFDKIVNMVKESC